MYTAIENGDLEEVKRLMGGVSYGNQPLVRAVMHNQMDVLKYLVEIYGSLYHCDGPLKHAALSQNEEMIEYLLSHDAGVHDLQEALCELARVGNIEAAEVVIKYGAKISEYCIIDALKKKRDRFVKHFITSLHEYQLVIVLCHAIQINNIDIVHYAIDKRIYVPTNDHELIKSTVCHGRVELTRYLMMLGAPIDVCYQPCLHKVARSGYVEMMKLLVDHDRDRVINDSDVFREACRHGKMDMIKYLVAIGVNPVITENTLSWMIIHGLRDVVNFVTMGYQIPLSQEIFRLAAYRGYLLIVKKLVEDGIDITHDNNSAIKCASGQGHMAIIRYLITRGASIGDKYLSEIKGRIDKGHIQDVDYFLTICPHYVNDKLLTRAIDCGHRQIIRLFVSRGVFDNRLDPYEYLGCLDERHLDYLDDHPVVCMIKKRRRLYAGFHDVIISLI